MRDQSEEVHRLRRFPTPVQPTPRTWWHTVCTLRGRKRRGTDTWSSWDPLPTNVFDHGCMNGEGVGQAREQGIRRRRRKQLADSGAQ